MKHAIDEFMLVMIHIETVCLVLKYIACLFGSLVFVFFWWLGPMYPGFFGMKSELNVIVLLRRVMYQSLVPSCQFLCHFLFVFFSILLSWLDTEILWV